MLQILQEFFGRYAGTAASDTRYPRRILIRSRGRISFVRVEEIDWIESAGNYVRLHLGETVQVMRATMKDLERRLDTREFIRIHRFTIVRIDRIVELRPWRTGEYVVLLRSGKELTLTRGYRARLRAVLEGGVQVADGSPQAAAQPSGADTFCQ